MSFSYSDIHPNLKLMSHSSDMLLDKCPRKYELTKLSPQDHRMEARAISSHEELMYFPPGDIHLDFGTVVGIGVQEFLVSGSQKQAYLKMLLACEGHIDDDAGVSSKKTFWYALHALDRFIAFRSTALSTYSLAYFNGKPAIELGFIIDCGDGFYYRGFLDALLINDLTKEFVPLEDKTTKFKTVHEATYKNSGQGLGYSLIVDAIATLLNQDLGSSFKVKYLIWKTSGGEWEQFDFPKNHTQRALWIRALLLRKKRIAEFAELNYFPMQGWNCYDFFRPCPFFGTCELSNDSLIGPLEKVPLRVDDPSKYQFHFKLDDIINAQLLRHEDVL